MLKQKVVDRIKVSNLSLRDIPDVVNIVDCVQLNNFSNNEKNGFLIFNLGKDEYERKLKENNDFSFGIYDENKLIGFIICMNRKQILEDIDSTCLEYERNILKKPFEYVKDDFIWGDQIAIFPEIYRRKGYGKYLLQNVFKKMKASNVNHFFGMFSIYPHSNIPGFNFLLKNNLKILETINYRDIKWGLVYHEIK